MKSFDYNEENIVANERQFENIGPNPSHYNYGELNN